MKILSVKDISEAFASFADSLSYDEFEKGGVDYLVSIEARQFNFSGDSTFSYMDMKEVYNGEEGIQGASQKISWDLFAKEWKAAFAYCSAAGGKYSSRLKGHVVSDPLIELRFNQFVRILKSFTMLPPEKILRYIPGEDGSFFSEYNIWGLCHILIRGNRGIVVSAITID